MRELRLAGTIQLKREAGINAEAPRTQRCAEEDRERGGKMGRSADSSAKPERCS